MRDTLVTPSSNDSLGLLWIAALALASLPPPSVAADWYASDLARATRRYHCPSSVPPDALRFLAKTHSRSSRQISSDLLSLYRWTARQRMLGRDPGQLELRDEYLGENSDLALPNENPVDQVEQLQLAQALSRSPRKYGQARKWARLAADKGNVTARALLVDLERPVPTFDWIALQERWQHESETPPGNRIRLERDVHGFRLSVVPGKHPGALRPLQGKLVRSSLARDLFVAAARVADSPDRVDLYDSTGFLEVSTGGTVKRYVLEARSDHSEAKWTFSDLWEDSLLLAIVSEDGCEASGVIPPEPDSEAGGTTGHSTR